MRPWSYWAVGVYAILQEKGKRTAQVISEISKAATPTTGPKYTGEAASTSVSKSRTAWQSCKHGAPTESHRGRAALPHGGEVTLPPQWAWRTEQ